MNRATKPELLAPAGNMQALCAAFKHGADAVYLGAEAFGARASAGFDEAALQQAIHLAHLHGKRVYVTFNTLIKQQEWQAAKDLLAQLDEANVDAVIVQDIGLVQHIKQMHPTLPIHASTQMSIHNAVGAQLLLAQGVDRVVLARECSLSSIQAVAATGIEVEVFVHGALCVAVSGQCLLSSQIGGRSGNRGRCAQPCRMRYRYRGQDGAWLSPRDLMQLEGIPALIEAGATSFKIEGRLKSSGYVAAVTRAYRAAIDAAWNGQDASRAAKTQQKDLLQMFNRGGFTSGLTFDRGNPQFINPQRVAHDGIPVGTVKATGQRGQTYFSDTLLTEEINHGDHLQIRGQTEQEMIYSGPTIAAGQTVTLRHHRAASSGSTVHRLLDAALEKRLLEETEAPFSPIPVHALLTARVGAPISLTLRDERGNEVVAQGAEVQPARSSPLTLESARKAIEKTGESPFAIEHFSFDADADGFLPVSTLNAVRRDALAMLEEKRVKSWVRANSRQASATTRTVAPLDAAPTLYARYRSIEHAELLSAAGANVLIYAPHDYTVPTIRDELERMRPEDYFCLPRQATDETLHHLHTLCCETEVNVVVENIAQLHLAWPARVIAGDGIPAWNTAARRFLHQNGCSGTLMSAEVIREEAQPLLDETSMADMVRVYGRVTAMLLNHCPERVFRGLSGPQTACRLCDKGEGTRGQTLVDGKGAVYPLLPIRLQEGCLNQLLFHTPLHLSRQAYGTHWLLDFTTETTQEMKAVTRYYAAMIKGNELPPLDIPFYLGRLNEGVQ